MKVKSLRTNNCFDIFEIRNTINLNRPKIRILTSVSISNADQYSFPPTFAFQAP